MPTLAEKEAMERRFCQAHPVMRTGGDQRVTEVKAKGYRVGDRPSTPQESRNFFRRHFGKKQ